MTLQGEALAVTDIGVNEAPIETFNIVTENGIVHTIKKALIPPTILGKVLDGTLTNTTPPGSSDAMMFSASRWAEAWAAMMGGAALLAV